MRWCDQRLGCVLGTSDPTERERERERERSKQKECEREREIERDGM